jgi:hypothetical protein
MLGLLPHAGEQFAPTQTQHEMQWQHFILCHVGVGRRGLRGFLQGTEPFPGLGSKSRGVQQRCPGQNVRPCSCMHGCRGANFYLSL